MSAIPAALITGGATLAGGLLGGSGYSPNYSYGYDEGSSFGQQGSSSSGSSMSWQDPATVWDVQSPYLQNLYQQASAQLGATQGNADAAAGWVNQGMGALSDLMNPAANPMMAVYQQQLQQGLDQYILPSIRREATQVNAIGGTRQGVAEGLAASEALRQQNQFAAQLYGQDRDRMLQAAGQVPGMAQAGLGVPWYGLQQLAGILGDPVVLAGGGGSIGEQSSSSFGIQGSESFGEQFGGPDADNPYVPGGGGGGGGNGNQPEELFWDPGT